MNDQSEVNEKHCCGPDCCGSESSSATAVVSENELRNSIREHYGKIATEGGSCCGPNCGCGSQSDERVLSIMMNDKYQNVDEQIIAAADMGLGCGTPTAFADLKPGMRVLDLGSGAGIDVFLAAKAVAPTGKAIGLDMTDEMLRRARTNKAKLGMTNAEFWKGEIEDIPVESDTIDRVISNCVINLVPDKKKAFSEIFRVLKQGGVFTVSDVVSLGRIPLEVQRDSELWAGCIAGAIDKEEYLEIVRNVGFKNLTVSAEKPYNFEGSKSFGLESITLTATK